MPKITGKLEIQPSNHKEYHTFYMMNHSQPNTRRCHFVGTIIAVAGAVASIVTNNLIALCSSVGAGLAITWGGDKLIEKKNPSFFKNPVYATMSNFKMMWQMVKGDVKF